MENQSNIDLNPAFPQYNCRKCKDKGFIYVTSPCESMSPYDSFGMVDVVPEDCPNCTPEPSDGQPDLMKEYEDLGEVYDDEPTYI